nr:MAG TPA: hypothetical protein [Caudoviricetes sp.]
MPLVFNEKFLIVHIQISCICRKKQLGCIWSTIYA